jgi:hypothetical protein
MLKGGDIQQRKIDEMRKNYNIIIEGEAKQR